VEKARGSGIDQLGGMQKVAARQDVSFATAGTSFKYQLCRAFGILLPNRGDFVVLRFPLGNCRAPVTEYRLYL